MERANPASGSARRRLGEWLGRHPGVVPLILVTLVGLLVFPPLFKALARYDRYVDGDVSLVNLVWLALAVVLSIVALWARGSLRRDLADATRRVLGGEGASEARSTGAGYRPNAPSLAVAIVGALLNLLLLFIIQAILRTPLVAVGEAYASRETVDGGYVALVFVIALLLLFRLRRAGQPLVEHLVSTGLDQLVPTAGYAGRSLPVNAPVPPAPPAAEATVPSRGEPPRQPAPPLGEATVPGPREAPPAPEATLPETSAPAAPSPAEVTVAGPGAAARPEPAEVTALAAPGGPPEGLSPAHPLARSGDDSPSADGAAALSEEPSTPSARPMPSPEPAEVTVLGVPSDVPVAAAEAKAQPADATVLGVEPAAAPEEPHQAPVVPGPGAARPPESAPAAEHASAGRGAPAPTPPPAPVEPAHPSGQVLETVPEPVAPAAVPEPTGPPDATLVGGEVDMPIESAPVAAPPASEPAGPDATVVESAPAAATPPSAPPKPTLPWSRRRFGPEGAPARPSPPGAPGDAPPPSPAQPARPAGPVRWSERTFVPRPEPEADRTLAPAEPQAAPADQTLVSGGSGEGPTGSPSPRPPKPWERSRRSAGADDDRTIAGDETLGGGA